MERKKKREEISWAEVETQLGSLAQWASKLPVTAAN